MVLSIPKAADNRESSYPASFPVRFLLISVAVHAALFLLGRNADPWTFSAPRQEIFHVQLLHNPASPDTGGTETDPPSPAAAGGIELRDEDTVRLGEQKGRYAGYAGLIKKRLSAAWIYPEQAGKEGLEGTVKVRFTVERDGNVSASYLVESSEHDRLDENVIDAVARAAPYPPFPDRFVIARLHVEASFTYRLSEP